MKILALLLTALNVLSATESVIEANHHASGGAPGRLPLVLLQTKEGIVSDRKVGCTVATDESGSQPGKPVSGVIRFHGASSQAYPKKSFAIALDQPVNWLGMRESAHWVLNAAFVDRSLMRHKLSYDLFRSLSMTNAPRFAAASSFVEVDLNGNYNGVYLLMERIDRAMLGLRPYDTNTSQHACIYKAVDHAAFRHLSHYGYEQREPDPLVRGQYWEPLDRLNGFVSTSKNQEFFDPGKGISTQFDLDNAIDFHLLILLTSNMDGYDKNLILARDAPRTNAPPPRFFFVPWDYDATFGRNWESSPVGTTAWLSNHLFERLLSNRDYRKRFVARWKELRQRQFSVQSIYALVDENVRVLSDAPERNGKRWRAAAGMYRDRLTFAQDVAEMKDWINRRTMWLDQKIIQ